MLETTIISRVSNLCRQTPSWQRSNKNVTEIDTFDTKRYHYQIYYQCMHFKAACIWMHFLMHHSLLHLFDCIILVHVSSRTSPYSINLEAVCFHSRLFQNFHPSHEKFLQRWKILDKKSISWSKNPSFLKMDWYTVHVCSTWWHAFNHRAPDCK